VPVLGHADQALSHKTRHPIATAPCRFHGSVGAARAKLNELEQALLGSGWTQVRELDGPPDSANPSGST
jgi:hypothetical protein